jgi:hypothetical protein
MKTITPNATARRVYIQGFGAECCDCGRRTFGKLADHARGTCGTYFTNITPLCARCHRRITRASAKAVKEAAR